MILDFDSGFKPMKKIPDGASSKNTIELDLIFKSNSIFNEIFLNIKNFKLENFPKKNNYNFITTNMLLSTLDFLDLFQYQKLTKIYMFITKIDKKNKVRFQKYSSKTILFTNDECRETPASKIIICATHAKALVFSIDNDFYTIIGSGNPSHNSHREQYIIFNDKEIFNQFKNICSKKQ